MTTNKQAIDNTEDEFQAALATYTKAGNKTAAMRRLWNAAYEKGKMAAVAAEARRPDGGLVLRKDDEFGEKGAMMVDAVELVFASGKADGMEIGREKENLRWKELGHFEDDAGIEADPSSPFANTTNVMAMLRLEKSIQHIATAPYKTLWLSRKYDPETELLLFTTSTVCTFYEQRAFGQQQFLVGSFGVGFGWLVDTDSHRGCLIGFRRAVGNEDVALLRGVDAVGRSGGFGPLEACLVTCLRML
ncbi:hypothetical protein DFH08DRAFT_817195 [Mycena albidolilacea]|uniref:Uncharacterized protein n=1 Tax=Mycena albidolilacea TaxID=1033008 RepID=A0AAD6ZIT1_9AGAR|nr:hypothetical protein DFH08DRAFT_817195 [Mycena albidolilacea]